MATSSLLRTNKDQHFFPSRGLPRLLLLILLFAGALGIRLYHIGDPPVDFHPTRQYRSALLARAIYFAADNSVTEQDKAIALAARPSILEPPLGEYLASWLYQLAGTENLLIPRLLAVLFWVIAAVFFYKLSMYTISPDAAVLSTAFFLFVPFGIRASRSFQPDPLMIMTFLGAIWVILQYRRDPSTRLFIIAAALAALAIFVKPVCIFPIWLVFWLTGITGKGVWLTLRNMYTAAFCFFSILPTLLFYGYGIFIAGFLKDQANFSFVPALLSKEFFWQGWLLLIFKVIGPGGLYISILGLLLVRFSPMTRNLLIAIWGGYFIFGLVFTYHIHTHDYYHLMLIPITALSLGAALAAFLNWLSTSKIWQWTAVGALLAALVIYFGETIWWYRRIPDTKLKIALFQKIGEHTGYSTRTVFLAENYGNPLQYHAPLAGSNWPIQADFWAAQLRGEQIQRGKERLAHLISTMSPEYFIITNLVEFHKQKDLKETLSNYPLLASTDSYRIYDLREIDSKNRSLTNKRTGAPPQSRYLTQYPSQTPQNHK